MYGTYIQGKWLKNDNDITASTYYLYALYECLCLNMCAKPIQEWQVKGYLVGLTLIQFAIFVNNDSEMLIGGKQKRKKLCQTTSYRNLITQIVSHS